MDYCCVKMADASNEMFNVIQNDIIRQADLFSREDKINFCPFCGKELS